ncbi:hypothetical protein ABBQ32_010245 [Trebouxia sp. C0010 RCD-2024]
MGVVSLPLRLGQASHMAAPGSSDVPPWQSTFLQVLEMDHQNKFVQVATVREDGKPACRTMAFAGFITGTQQALLQTHAKSYKADHLAKCSWIEICSWNSATQQQFRLKGLVDVVDEHTTDHSMRSMRQEQWRQVGTPSTLQWYQNADRAPGHAYKPPVELPIDKQGKAPPSFLMLVVDIREVDYVHLQSDTRAVWKKQTADSGGEHTGRSQPLWYKEEVNP